MPYVSFNGIRSDSINGLIIEQFPVWKRPRRRYNSESPSGYDGRVYMDDKPYDTFSTNMRFSAMNQAALEAANALFDGEGWMISSREPNRKVYVRAYLETQPTQHKAGDTSVLVTLECMPFKYATPDAADIVKTTSGTTITNAGTAPSSPKITIDGDGTFTVTIGDKSLFFENVPSGGIMYDADLKDALSPDGTVLMTQYMQFISDFDIKIPVGTSTVSWTEAQADAEEGISAGHVTSVTITPRWRYL